MIPDEVLMISTDVNRTIQSGYSELMGLYPPGQQSGAEPLTSGMAKNIRQEWTTPFKVRDAEKINDQLGFAALPNEFTAKPILLYLNPDLNDDASTNGCQWINDVGKARANDQSIWRKYDLWRAEIDKPLQESLGLSPDEEAVKDFHTYQTYTDTAVAENFEGIFKEKTFYTDEQWETTNEFQRAWLSDDYSPDARDLMMSRLLRKPLKVMRKRVDDILGTKESFLRDSKGVDNNELKFMIYSAHDTQVDNMLVFLSESEESFDFVPFASQVTFELKYSASCVNGIAPSEACFGVSVLSNGEPMSFSACSGDGFSEDGTGCTYSEFT